MRPAFASTKSAAAFALMLFVLLALPIVLKKNPLSREQAYAIPGWGTGPYPWIRNQVFEETNDIDIAFIGSSHIWNAINTPYVQAKLSERLGRPAVVRTIAWGGAGNDALFFITRDLLEHRRVKTLVFYDEGPLVPGRNSHTSFLFRLDEDARLLAGLEFRDKELFYLASLIGTPRNLLGLIRPNLPAPLITDRSNYWTLVTGSPNPATLSGGLFVRLGFAPNPMVEHTSFKPFAPETAAGSADAVIYSPQTKAEFKFLNAQIPSWQIHFARKLAELFHAHNVPAVMVHLPVLAEVRAPLVSERADWSQIFGGEVKLLGIPPTKLFGGLTDAEVLQLFADPGHFNKNGQDYFTPLVTPALIQIYENQPHY